MQADLAELPSRRAGGHRRATGSSISAAFRSKGLGHDPEGKYHRLPITCSRPPVVTASSASCLLPPIMSSDSIHVAAASERIAPVRPDSRYGVSKAFGEALGGALRLQAWAARYLIRIGNVERRPRRSSAGCRSGSRRRIWCNSIRIGLEHPDIRYEIFYGASDNARGWWDNARPSASATGRAAAPRTMPRRAFAAQAKLPRRRRGRMVSGRAILQRPFHQRNRKRPAPRLQAAPVKRRLFEGRKIDIVKTAHIDRNHFPALRCVAARECSNPALRTEQVVDVFLPN